MERTAYAKINWDLHILGKRPDGYHEIDTVMVEVGLADRLLAEPAGDLAMTCSDPSLPCDDRNLVVRAAKALAQAAGVPAQARIHLEKHIPAGGGLGGGSSDAAHALLALNELWGLGWPRERLNEIAAGLGSDIGFFLWGGWARCRGRGEIVEALPESSNWPSIRLLLLLPGVSVPTPPVFKALSAQAFDGKRCPRNLTSLAQNLNLTMLNFLGVNVFREWPANDLQAAACRVEPALKELQACLRRRFDGRWQMSGSGAVHVVLPMAHETASQVEESLRAELGSDLRVVETTTVTSGRSS